MCIGWSNLIKSALYSLLTAQHHLLYIKVNGILTNIIFKKIFILGIRLFSCFEDDIFQKKSPLTNFNLTLGSKSIFAQNKIHIIPVGGR